ncbi:hypothetical protein MPH_07725 [Macrophomina phaseolina MS6]|uniref:Uncharacterized protein n=1 Tax=Macrophomina phaseolina (strain MS6) TaxID=1126212 RepID=K2RQN8_MACPH|nr:hypothetical protein MPH_07725 [Macrophomina phaseolina MS6]
MRSISTLMPLSAMGAIANAAPISSSPSSLIGAADLLPRSVDAAATSLMARKEIEHETEDSHIAGTDDAAHRHRAQEGKDDSGSGRHGGDHTRRSELESHGEYEAERHGAGETEHRHRGGRKGGDHGSS